MIDIHSHVLVHADDGPRTIDNSIELLKQAKIEGITGIIATPHHLHPNWSNSFMDVEKKIKFIQNHPQVKEMGIKIYPGQEIRIKDLIFEEIENGMIKGLNNSKYLLLELPSSRVPSATNNIVFKLQEKGFIPIIAHPERNKQIANEPELLYELVNAGALAQITASSLNGDLGKKIQSLSIKMIENNLVHFISSDAHNLETRPFIAESLLKNNKLKFMEDRIEILFKNSEKILENKNIVKHIPEKIVLRKKIFGLF